MNVTLGIVKLVAQNAGAAGHWMEQELRGKALADAFPKKYNKNITGEMIATRILIGVKDVAHANGVMRWTIKATQSSVVHKLLADVHQ